MARALQKPQVRARSAKPVRALVTQIAIVLAALLLLAAGWALMLWLLWRSWYSPI
jgi:fatty acid desaturase